MRRAAMALTLLLAAGCAEEKNSPPSFLPLDNQTCRANTPCRIDVTASDGDDDALEFDFSMDPPPVTDTQGVGGRPQMQQIRRDTAAFVWTPGNADAGDGEIAYAVTFTVSDGSGGKDEETITLRVTADAPGPAAITFTDPPGAGKAVDLTRDDCVSDLEVAVKADAIRDDQMVLELAQPAPEGATLTPRTGLQKNQLFNWCPTDAQLDTSLSHTVTFVAHRQGDAESVSKRFTIRFKRPNSSGCPGQAPRIEHEPPGTLSGPLNYEIRVRVTDDLPLKSAPQLLFSAAPDALPVGGAAPDTSDWQLVDFVKAAGDDWVASIPNLLLADGDERPVHYVVLVTDNDDPNGNRCDHTTESQPFTFIARGGGGGGQTYGFCAPCVDDTQCGDADDFCVDLRGESFCTSSCSDAQCPAGQECVEVTSVAGATAYQCVPADLNCGQICVADTFDGATPNDDANDATPLEPGTYQNLSICDQDIDYFVIDVFPQQSIRVRAEFDNARGDIDLAMQLPGQSEFDYQSLNGDTNVEMVQEPCVELAGSALVAVFPYQNVRNSYRLTVETGPGDCNQVCDDDSLDDDPRGNDVPEEFAPIDRFPFTREGLRICRQDPDYYGFDAAAGEFVRVGIAFDHAAGDLQLRLLRSTGDVVGESESFRDAELIERVVPVDDVYIVEVSGATRSVANLYDLVIEKMEVQACEGTHDCPAGQYCYRGACTDAYCAEANGCGLGHRCVPPRAGLAPEAGGECVDECFAPADCRAESGYTCKRFEDFTTACAPAGAAGPGERCADYADCNGEQVCLNLPGGYCAVGGCDADLPCDAATVCVDLGAFAACLKRCAGDGDCRVGEGYRCQDLSGERVCLP